MIHPRYSEWYAACFLLSVYALRSFPWTAISHRYAKFLDMTGLRALEGRYLGSQSSRSNGCETISEVERCKSFAFLTEAKFATLRTSTRHKSLWTSARALGKHFTGQNSSVNRSFYSILTEWNKGRIETSWIVTFCRSCFHYPRNCFRCESFPRSRICGVTQQSCPWGHATGFLGVVLI